MTTESVQHNILETKKAIEELNALNSNSKVSIWRLMVYVFSFTASSLSKLIALHKQEIIALIDAQHFSSENFLKTLLFNFRYGHLYDREQLKYIGTYTDEQIEKAKIIKRAAVEVLVSQGRRTLRIKVAKMVNGKLERVPADELLAVQEYTDINVSVGTNIEFYSANPDRLRLFIDFYYDPLILDPSGELIDGSAPAPVPTAIDAFLSSENFDFNGEFRISALTDVLQNLVGCAKKSVKIKQAQYSNQIPDYWENINEAKVAVSGAFEVRPENLTINYIAKYVR